MPIGIMGVAGAAAYWIVVKERREVEVWKNLIGIGVLLSFGITLFSLITSLIPGIAIGRFLVTTPAFITALPWTIITTFVFSLLEYFIGVSIVPIIEYIEDWF